MLRRTILTVAIFGLCSIAQAAGTSFPDLKSAATAALSENAETATAAIASLRDAGPAGLASLFETHTDLLPKRDAFIPEPEKPEWPRLKAAIDAVAAQRDADFSRLYWHTDLDAATAAARREHKPILSLRLLGKLTDEFSCANSRYFRTALYANPEIADFLRDRFILHWQSVRPVPRITIDFGDGRKLERTLTGNSVHYVLDSEGRPFDALPGLYGPQAFLRELKAIEVAMNDRSKLEGSERDASLAQYHRGQVLATERAWRTDLAQLKVPVPPAFGREVQPGQQPARVDARVAGERAVPKSKAEAPILRALSLTSTQALKNVTTDEVWFRLGQLHDKDSRLGPASIDLIRRQNHIPPMNLAFCSIPEGEMKLAVLVDNFQKAMSADSIRNEYELRRQIHEWFAAAPNPQLDALNDRVYAELFLTPRSDPWLGLEAPDTYTALENGGRRDN